MCEAKDCSVAHRFGQEDNTRFRKEQIVKSTCCICSQALETIRPYKPVLIGSASYGNVFNDIDMLICVDAAKLEEVERQLSQLGFTRQVPDPETFDPRVHSAWKLEKLDIQLATPANYDSKVAAHREVLRKRLYKGLSKAARYALLCSLM